MVLKWVPDDWLEILLKYIKYNIAFCFFDSHTWLPVTYFITVKNNVKAYVFNLHWGLIPKHNQILQYPKNFGASKNKNHLRTLCLVLNVCDTQEHPHHETSQIPPQIIKRVWVTRSLGHRPQTHLAKKRRTPCHSHIGPKISSADRSQSPRVRF